MKTDKPPANPVTRENCSSVEQLAVAGAEVIYRVGDDSCKSGRYQLSKAITAGSCEIAQGGRLEFHKDGTAQFTADVMTTKTLNRDVWHMRWSWSTKDGTHTTTTLDSPKMPKTSEYYKWETTFPSVPAPVGAPTWIARC